MKAILTSLQLDFMLKNALLDADDEDSIDALPG